MAPRESNRLSQVLSKPGDFQLSSDHRHEGDELALLAEHEALRGLVRLGCLLGRLHLDDRDVLKQLKRILLLK